MTHQEKDNRTVFRRVFIAAIIGLCLFAIAPCAHAQSGSIAIHDTGANGLTLDLYQIATLNNDQFTAVEADYETVVADMPVDSKDHTDAWVAAAKKLHTIIQKNNIGALQSKTVSGGQLTFSHLTAGLYLMSGPAVTISGETVTPVPALITVQGETVTVTTVKKTTSAVPDNPTPEPTTPASPKTPQRVKTGDTTKIAVYVSLLIVTAIVLSLAAVNLRRRREKIGDN